MSVHNWIQYNLHCLCHFSNIISLQVLQGCGVWDMGYGRTRNEIQIQMKKVCTVAVFCCCVLPYMQIFLYEIIQQSYFVPFNVVYRCVRDCKQNCEKSKLKTIQFLCQTNKWIFSFYFFCFLLFLLLLLFIHSNYICLRSPVFTPVSLFPNPEYVLDMHNNNMLSSEFCISKQLRKCEMNNLMQSIHCEQWTMNSHPNRNRKIENTQQKKMKILHRPTMENYFTK